MTVADKLKSNDQKQQTALQTQQKQPTAIDWVNSPEISGLIAQALPKHLTPDRVLSVVAMAFRKNPKLQGCTKNSLLASIVTASQLGVEINSPLGHACIIPYENRKQIDGKWQSVLEAEFQLEYQGIIDLCYRSGEYETIYAELVDTADKMEIELGLNKRLVHIPSDDPADEIRGAYAVYKLKNGGYDFKYWPLKKILNHAKRYSQSYRQMLEKQAKGETVKKNPWADSPEGMYKKTVLKDVLKYAPKSVDLAKALVMDETVKADIGEDMSFIPDVIEGDAPENAIDVTPTEDTSADPGEKASEDQKKNSVEAPVQQLPTQTAQKPVEKVDPIVDKHAPAKAAEKEQMDRAMKQAEAFYKDPAHVAAKEEALQERAAEAQNTPVVVEKLAKEQLQRIHIFINDINKIYKLLGKEEIPDASYRDHLNTKYGVESSKDLTVDQAKEFIEMLLLKKVKLETSPEAKDARAAAYKAEKEGRPFPVAAGPDEKPVEKQPEKVRPANVNEDGEIIDPPKDFVKEARMKMLANKLSAGDPMYESEYREIGIDPSRVHPSRIKKTHQQEAQLDLFGGNDDDVPNFMKPQEWEK